MQSLYIYPFYEFYIYLSPVGGGGEGEDEMVQFALGLLDHVKSTRLSKEVGGASTHTHTDMCESTKCLSLSLYSQAKEKALRNRNRVAQGKEKLQHQQRQEVFVYIIRLRRERWEDMCTLRIS